MENTKKYFIFYENNNNIKKETHMNLDENKKNRFNKNYMYDKNFIKSSNKKNLYCFTQKGAGSFKLKLI